MSQPNNLSVNTQKIEDTEKFFNQWRVYQQVILNNDMRHKQIIAAYQQFIRNHLTHEFSVLDLGCGDATPAAQILRNSEASQYTGVDVSIKALQMAKTNLKEFNIAANFINNDLTEAIQNTVGQFDLVLAGYSIHHLKLSAKNNFFAHCSSAINPGGYLFFYDLIKLDEETREQCLQRHWTIYDTWDLSAPDKQLIKEHIFAQDYAESPEQYSELAQAHGFTKSECLFTDSNKLFGAFSFKNKNRADIGK